MGKQSAHPATVSRLNYIDLSRAAATGESTRSLRRGNVCFRDSADPCLRSISSSRARKLARENFSSCYRARKRRNEGQCARAKS